MRSPAPRCPRTRSGAKVNPREWNRNDGFSPGQPIMVHLPFLKTQAQFRRSGIVPVNDLAKYRSAPAAAAAARRADRQAPDRLGRARRRQGVPAASRHVVIHPAKNLVPGRRYVVVLRNLKRHAPRGLWRTTSRALRKALRKAKVSRSSVYLTWDFTVASDKSLTARLLKIRDDAFAQLGDRNLKDGVIQGKAPSFTVTERRELHAGAGRPHRSHDHGHVHRALLPGSHRMPAWLALPLLELEAGRAAHPDRRQRRPGAVPMQHPARRVLVSLAHLALRPRPAGRPHADRGG